MQGFIRVWQGGVLATPLHDFVTSWNSVSDVEKCKKIVCFHLYYSVPLTSIDEVLSYLGDASCVYAT